jgi:hypothetical protein
VTVSIGRGPHASRRALVGVALGYGACVAVCSYVAVRDGVPGRPLGIGVPLSVPTSLVAGWGSGVSAPWPMPVIAVVAAWQAHDARRGPATVAAVVGVASVTGHLIEPVTWQPSTRTPATTGAIVVGVLSAALLATAGTVRRWAATTARPGECAATS